MSDNVFSGMENSTVFSYLVFAFLFGFLLGFVLGIFFLTSISPLDEAVEKKEACEEYLPRNQNCVMKYVPPIEV